MILILKSAVMAIITSALAQGAESFSIPSSPSPLCVASYSISRSSQQSHFRLHRHIMLSGMLGCTDVECFSFDDSQCNNPDFTKKNDCERRLFLKQSALALSRFTTPTAALPFPAFGAEEETTGAIRPGNYNCLLDLPPITPGCARLYLCRHGQTENNRLHLVQGARVDPPLNSNGMEQAQRMGNAISRLIRNGADGNFILPIPSLVAHSKLKRARETAEILTSTADSLLTTSYSSFDSSSLPLRVFGEIPSLGEVDFGSMEGQDAKKVKSAMRSTFASWALGNIDKRLPGGESGREVLERAVDALEALKNLATESSSVSNKLPSIMAVTHSTYLRVLLSMVDDSPLAQSAMTKIQNGSINVIDVNIEGKKSEISLTSGLFGGGVMSVLGLGATALGRMEDFKLILPKAYLIRRNEVRHLDGLEA
mmetsp:Transcript_24705/g.49445  ORF Transcript_24705/g.49445 Transcript_24705/m.49445 type:complete len:425 (+) Transcript_24705:75-1349(+)